MNNETRRSYETAFGMNSLDEQRNGHYIGSSSKKESEPERSASHDHPLISKRPPRPYSMNPSRSHASCANSRIRRAIAFEETLARQSASECFLGERSKSLESFLLETDESESSSTKKSTPVRTTRREKTTRTRGIKFPNLPSS